jgi:hypothetical protein
MLCGDINSHNFWVARSSAKSAQQPFPPGRRGLFEKEIQSIGAGDYAVRVFINGEVSERLQSVHIENVKTAFALGWVATRTWRNSPLRSPSGDLCCSFEERDCAGRRLDGISRERHGRSDLEQLTYFAIFGPR